MSSSLSFTLATSSAPCLIAQDNAWTYRTLAEHRAQWGKALLAGTAAGARVAGLSLNHPEQVALLLACVDTGRVWVPLNTRLAPAEWAAVLADCGASVLVHDEAFAQAARGLAAGARTAAWAMGGTSGMAADDDAPTLGSPAVDAPALLVYTSGTTGQPKGAVHTVGNLLANAQAAVAAQGLTAADHVLTVLPLFHVGGLCIQTLPALLAGARVTLHSRFVPDAFFDALEAPDKPSLTLQVPATLKALAEHPRWAGADLSCLKAVWAGSSVIPEPLVRAVLAKGVPFCNVYGTTETGPFSVALGPTHGAPSGEQAGHYTGSCGWPAPGVELRLAPALSAASADGVGEIHLRGPAIVQRYWAGPGLPERPALDADGWFATGDLGRLAADGSLWVVGRSKDMIISGGENIYPAEIEQHLAALPGVAECAVVGLPDERWGEVPVAVVVRSHEPREPEGPSGSGLTAQQVIAHLQGLLARYKLPRRVVFVAELPKTALGKVQKATVAASIQSLHSL